MELLFEDAGFAMLVGDTSPVLRFIAPVTEDDEVGVFSYLLERKEADVEVALLFLPLLILSVL